MISHEQIETVKGATAYARNGEKIGTVTQVYLNADGQPDWIAVDTDLFASAEAHLPADGATLTAGALHLPITAEQVDTAPRIDLEEQLTPTVQQRLRDHYASPGTTDRE